MGKTRYKVKTKGARSGRGGGRRRIWPWVLLVLSGLAALGVVAAATAVLVVESQLPPVPTWEEYADGVPKVSRVVARDGTVVAEFFTQRRTLMRPGKLPPLLVKALVAAEDSSFFEHEGVSYWGIARATLINLWRGHVSQGGSTLTQQVVKQVLLTPERTMERKFRELLLARLLEQKLNKSEILAIYMSQIYLGHGRYGFEEAARFYFGKPADELGLAEAALLAGLASGPEANSPVRNPDGAIARQRYVLTRMVETGAVPASDARAAAQTAMPLVARNDPRLGAAPYFVDAVRREVTKLFGEGRLLHDGLTVETTLDLGISDAAETAVASGLGRLYSLGRTRDADERTAATGAPDALADGTDDLEEGIPPPPRAVRARVKGCDREHGRVEVEVNGTRATLNAASLGRLLLAGQPDLFSVCRAGEFPVSLANGERDIDGERAPMVNAELGPQAAMVVLDPKRRAVRALVGGEDHAARPFDRAAQSRRPIGSTVKPFLYAAALQQGVSPDETFPNVALHFRGAHGKSWTPRNYEGGYDGRDYSMTEALAKSINVIAVRVMSRIGAEAVADLLEALGILRAPHDLSLALGSAEASPLALANAMATFATGGLHDTPYLVERVTDAAGSELIQHEARPSRQVSSAVAGRIRDMMRQAVLVGTAREAASLPMHAWGKTGTTNRSREAWFAGSDGNLVTSILVGYDDRLPMHGATGGNTAVPLFVSFARILHGI